MVTGTNCWLAQTHISGEPQNQVSHETIYRSLFIQARGVLKKELLEHLRARRTIRRSKHASLKRNGLGQIKNAVSISERPASVEDRAVPGHWEGDLIGGSRNSYVATLVERHSRYVMLVKVANKDTESVVSALIKQSQRLPSELYRSLTWDRGKELADHQRLTLATEVEVYFCDPRSPWQRGSNENTNRLLRQYLPRGTDLSLHSQAKLSAIARQLNERPRKAAFEGNLAAARTSAGERQQTTRIGRCGGTRELGSRAVLRRPDPGLVRTIIAGGQASGELRPGSPMAMTCCLLEAMDGYLNPSRINAATVRPAFDEMMDFCAGALHHVPWGQSIDLAADLRPKAVAQG